MKFMEEKAKTKTFDIDRDISEAARDDYNKVIDSFRAWTKGSLNIEDMSVSELGGLYDAFSAATLFLDMADPKLAEFRRDVFVALTK